MRPNTAALIALSALAMAGIPFSESTPIRHRPPRPNAPINTPEINAWNARVEAKRQARKGKRK